MIEENYTSDLHLILMLKVEFFKLYLKANRFGQRIFSSLRTNINVTSPLNKAVAEKALYIHK